MNLLHQRKSTNAILCKPMINHAHQSVKINFMATISAPITILSYCSVPGKREKKKKKVECKKLNCEWCSGFASPARRYGSVFVDVIPIDDPVDAG